MKTLNVLEQTTLLRNATFVNSPFFVVFGRKIIRLLEEEGRNQIYLCNNSTIRHFDYLQIITLNIFSKWHHQNNVTNANLEIDDFFLKSCSQSYHICCPNDDAQVIHQHLYLHQNYIKHRMFLILFRKDNTQLHI